MLNLGQNVDSMNNGGLIKSTLVAISVAKEREIDLTVYQVW